MKSDELESLRTITETAYRADLAHLNRIATEEAQIQMEIVALIDDVARADGQEALSSMPLRHIGGDILWRGWVGRKRAQLNIRLATTRAQKEQALSSLKKSFGKMKVVEDLCDRERIRIKRQEEQRQLQNDQEQMIISAGIAKIKSNFC
ncbi:hypothetical protein [Rhodalgimonas zhirmunskyi]|uniref:Flagellar FliJ protein n=1 Tax=Rhodalgimonas zhirmunskyi TaxID=2964767 RepID=A0AAJ1X5U4_9RHOB|nr:hypothetical protein [Rhodoalgimonas zhirmunskyi]MDQ2093984.1 hypothetical protein [Rhodoalgimonas zhirmunskyi]